MEVTKHRLAGPYFDMLAPRIKTSADTVSTVEKSIKSLRDYMPLIAAATPIALGGAMAAGSAVFNKIQRARQKARGFQQMMAMHPVLKQRDPTMVQNLYNSIHTINPTLAVDPLVAGALINKTIEAGTAYGNDNTAIGSALPQVLEQIANIRARRAEAVSKEQGSGFAKGLLGASSVTRPVIEAGMPLVQRNAENELLSHLSPSDREALERRLQGKSAMNVHIRNKPVVDPGVRPLTDYMDRTVQD